MAVRQPATASSMSRTAAGPLTTGAGAPNTVDHPPADRGGAQGDCGRAPPRPAGLAVSSPSTRWAATRTDGPPTVLTARLPGSDQLRGDAEQGPGGRDLELAYAG